MKAIITGATGFVGRWLVKALKENGHECTVVVRPEQRGKIIKEELFSDTNVICLDMEEYEGLDYFIDGTDWMINLAWAGSRGTDRMDSVMQRNNYLCTMKAIECVANVGCKCIVTAGSQAEYGHIDGRISEETVPYPNTEYGKYKLKLYEDASSFCQKLGIRFIEPRYFSLYGPQDTDLTMIVSMLKKMISGEKCDLTESVQKWDFLYIEDAMEALLMLLLSESASGVFNFASGDCRELKSFIEDMRSVTKSTSQLCYGTVPYPPTGMVSIEPDITKLKNTVDWRAKTTFREGIEKVVESL